jgi:hypothetical protein
MTRAADLAKLIAGGGSITVDDNATTLSLVSTDADANSGPVQVLYRNSSSPADSDLVGEMHFRGRNDNSQDVEYVTISTRMEDVSDGTEDGKIILKTIVDGTARSRIEIDHTDVVINQDSIDSNFRVESNNQAGMIFVDAGNDRVGIGTVSPNHDLHLHKSTSDGNFLLITNSTTGSNSNDGAAIGLAADETLLIYHQESSDIRFGTGATERMRIDSDGHVGIGTTDPQVGLQVEASDGSVNGTIRLTATGVASAGMAMDANGLNFGADTGGFVFKTSATANDPSDTGTTRMSINSSGLVDIGAIGHTSSSMLDVASPNLSSTANGITVQNKTDNTGGYFLAFYRSNNALIGNISQGSGSVAYNTTSDYRLKENVVTDWDATTRLKQLKPSRFNFKEFKDTTVDGFLAHEVSSIVPEAITGTKDEVDTDDNPVYQGIDHSKLVPLMVKTIQELEARIATLESK